MVLILDDGGTNRPEQFQELMNQCRKIGNDGGFSGGFIDIMIRDANGLKAEKFPCPPEDYDNSKIVFENFDKYDWSSHFNTNKPYFGKRRSGRRRRSRRRSGRRKRSGRKSRKHRLRNN